MKVQELLTEKTKIIRPWKVFPVDVKRGIELLNEHCRASLADIKSGNVLFRGFATPPKARVAVIDSGASLRTSKDSNNIYQLAMDVAERYKGFPRRSSSFICTGELDDAARYGGSKGTYAMIPYDGTPVASAKARDIFSAAMPFGMADVTGFDSCVEHALQRLGIMPDSQYKYTSAKRLNAELSKHSVEAILFHLMENCEEIGSEYRAEEIYERKTMHGDIYKIASGNAKKVDVQVAKEAVRASLKKLGKDLLQRMTADKASRFNVLADVFMDPGIMNVALQYPGSLKLRGEAWFSGECVAIFLPVFNSILKEFGKNANQGLVNSVDYEVS